MLVRLALASVLLVGCLPTDSEQDDGPAPYAHQLDVAKLSPAARARVIRAAETDLEAAAWIGHQLRTNWSPCTTVSGTLNTTLTVSGQDCNGFTGTLAIKDGEAFDFDHVTFGDLELDGTVVEHFSETSFLESIDMTITRDGVAVHSTYETDANGPQAGATLSIDGDAVQFTRGPNVLTFTTFDPAIAPFEFTHDGPCGDDPITGTPICLSNTEPTTFTTGTLRKLDRVCDGNDAKLQFVTTSGQLLEAWVDGIHMQLGSNTWDEATGLYTFETSDGVCDNRQTFHDYYVKQPPAYRAELLIVPHLVWSYE